MARPLVMIVDDDCEIQALLREALGSDRFEVVCCSDGAEALRLLEEQRPALLLVDLMMPVMNGWELVAELQRDPALREVPILVLTAAGTHWGYPVPNERVVQKPFELDELLRRVDETLRAQPSVPWAPLPARPCSTP